MKVNEYKQGDYVVGWFDNIVKLGKPIVLPTNQHGFKTDFQIGSTSQNISLESIQRKCTKKEIKEYKEKYENITK